MDIGRGATPPSVSLDYPDIRDQIQDGDILLFRGKSWTSRLICWVTGSPYSHSAILCWWNGRLMVLEAVSTGVVISRLSLVVNQYSGKVELWTTDENLARFEVIRAAQILLGKRYSKFKLVRNLKRLLFGRGRQEPLDPEAPPEDFLCSEFVSRVWRAGGIDLVNEAPDVYTKPGDIAKSARVRKVGDLVRGRPGAGRPGASRPSTSRPSTSRPSTSSRHTARRLPERSVGSR